MSKLLASVLILMSLFCGELFAQQSQEDRIWNELRRLSWQHGPNKGRVGTNASIQIPSGHVLLQSEDTNKFLVLMGNLPSSNRYAFGPQSLDWFSVFNFSEIGYVKDDEKVDPDQILASLKADNVEANKERKARGLEPLILEGWLVAPHYDLQTKRLEWGTKLRSPSGEITANYHIRILGRTGVMNALLVSDPSSLDSDIRAFKAQLAGFSFDPGQRYAEFRSGDRVAEYGLTALIVGGAAAAAAKSGIFKILGKFAVYIFGGAALLIFGLIKALFGARRPSA